jgi:3-phenylpropionate/cinnamic acid dioxygenase small subunit
MTDLDRLLAEHAIARRITHYAALNDAARWDELAALFTPNGRVNRPTAPDNFTTGRDAILAAFQSRPPRHSRHITANILVTVADDGQSATAQSQILLFTAANTTPLVGTYHDQLEQHAGQWLFAERKGSLDF